MPTEYSSVVADEILQETDAAFLIEFEDVGRLWIPKSQIEDPDDIVVGDKNVVVEIATWLAEKEDLT